MRKWPREGSSHMSPVSHLRGSEVYTGEQAREWEKGSVVRWAEGAV